MAASAVGAQIGANTGGSGSQSVGAGVGSSNVGSAAFGIGPQAGAGVGAQALQDSTGASLPSTGVPAASRVHQPSAW